MYTFQASQPGWNPYSELRRMQETMNRLFEDRTSTNRAGFPAVNIYARDDAVLVTAELPGFENEGLDLTVRDDLLTIEGEIGEANGDDVQGWHRRERGRGQFARTIELPFRVNPDNVEARFEGGLLEVEMRRPDEDKPRHITVNA